MDKNDEERSASERIMEGLLAEAYAAGDPRRLETLERLRIACDDLLSGKAAEMAKALGEDPQIFRMTGRKLTPTMVHRYVKLRQRMGDQAYWTGPVEATIAGHERMRSYVKDRSLEAGLQTIKPRRGARQRELEEIVSSIKPMNDQTRIRAALEEGRLHKTELDLLRAALRKIPEIDEALITGKKPGRDATVIHPPLGREERSVLQTLIARITDNGYIREAGLVFEKGRLRMSYPPGKDILLPEEVRVLRMLAGMLD
jgi:hypothetical protein